MRWRKHEQTAVQLQGGTLGYFLAAYICMWPAPLWSRSERCGDSAPLSNHSTSRSMVFLSANDMRDRAGPSPSAEGG